MIYTREQFINQNAFWQDKYYSYAIHITDGGAKYLFQVDGTRLTQKQLDSMTMIRLDGMDVEKFIENIRRTK